MTRILVVDDNYQNVYLLEAMLKGNGALPCPPPVNEGDVALLVGEDGDARLLSS